MLLVALAIISACLLVFLITFNGLVHQRQEIRFAWAKMDDLLKVRYRLVAELSRIESVSGKLTAVIAAKNLAAVALDHEQLAKAESALTLALKEIMTGGNSDPLLSHQQNWISLSTTISENDKLIAQACKRYNHHVHALNFSISGFPHQMTAALVGLRLQPIFNLCD